MLPAAASPGLHRVAPFAPGPTNPGPQGGFRPSSLLLDELEPGLRAVHAKVEAGERLSREDGRLLFATPDLNAVGALANLVNERLNGNRTTFTYNRHLNYTNVCAYRCMFCAFRRDGDEADAVVMDMDFVRHKLRREFTDTMREVHIVGGINPELPYEYYLELLRTIRAERPNLHIKAFTMIELDAMAQLAGKPLEAVVADLRAAGLGSCPGGGAEVLSPRVHRKLYREKLPPERWIAACKTVHQAGLHTNATMLFGHIETTDERLDHMLAIRAIQDETGGFLQFIPLVFHPDHTPLQRLGKTSGLDALRTIAVARLMLDNVPHVKAYWIMLGVKVAQLALSFGANDIDGTVTWERIYHMAGAETPEGLTEERLREVIREAGREPVERDAFYNPVARDSEGARGTNP